MEIDYIGLARMGTGLIQMDGTVGALIAEPYCKGKDVLFTIILPEQKYHNKQVNIEELTSSKCANMALMSIMTSFIIQTKEKE